MHLHGCCSVIAHSSSTPDPLLHCPPGPACTPCTPQALSSRDMTTFLLRAPPALFSSCTQAQALKVLAFLKRDLGVKQEYLFPRIVCAAPGVLLQVCWHRPHAYSCMLQLDMSATTTAA